MGLSVGGLGLLGISLIAYWLSSGETSHIESAAGFGMDHLQLHYSLESVAVFTPRLLTLVQTL